MNKTGIVMGIEDITGEILGDISSQRKKNLVLGAVSWN